MGPAIQSFVPAGEESRRRRGGEKEGGLPCPVRGHAPAHLEQAACAPGEAGLHTIPS